MPWNSRGIWKLLSINRPNGVNWPLSSLRKSRPRTWQDESERRVGWYGRGVGGGSAGGTEEVESQGAKGLRVVTRVRRGADWLSKLRATVHWGAAHLPREVVLVILARRQTKDQVEEGSHRTPRLEQPKERIA